MHEEVQKLRQVGYERVQKLFRILSIFPHLSARILELFYSKREPISMPDIFAYLKTKKKRKVQYVVEKLLELELLEKSVRPILAKRKNLNYYTIGRLGLDIFKQTYLFALTTEETKALSMSHSFKVLFAFVAENDIMSWSDLRVKSDLSESSLSRVLNAFEDVKLITKHQERGYYLTEKGKEVEETISRLSMLTIPPAYEVQVKVAVDSLSDILKKIQESNLGSGQGLTIIQEDYYLFPTSSARSDSYLRYRTEQKLDSSGRFVGAPKRTLSWTQNISPVFHRGIYITRRKREDMEVPYPTILFFLEYLDARIKKKVVKIRHKIDTRIGSEDVEIHLDELKSITKKGRRSFVEIKTVALNTEEAEEKCGQILELMSMLGLRESAIYEKPYCELVD